MKTIKSTKYMLRISVVPLVALLFFIAPAAPVKGQGRTPVSIAIVNGGFDSGNFTGWTLSGDTEDTFVDDGSTYWGIPPYSGGYCAELGTTSPNSFGYLTQTLTVLFVSRLQAAAQGADYLPAYAPPQWRRTNKLFDFLLVE